MSADAIYPMPDAGDHKTVKLQGIVYECCVVAGMAETKPQPNRYIERMSMEVLSFANICSPAKWVAFLFALVLCRIRQFPENCLIFYLAQGEVRKSRILRLRFEVSPRPWMPGQLMLRMVKAARPCVMVHIACEHFTQGHHA